MRAVLRNRALVTLMFGHFSNDLLAGFLTVFLPVARDRFDLSNGQAGLIALSYASASSVSQPFFGWAADRRFLTWLPPAVLIWGGVCTASYGLAPSYGVLLACAAAAGIASGAYHPLGASGASAVTDPRTRNTAMSLYTVGGTSGFALGPVVGVVALWAFGPAGSVVFLPLALVAAVAMARQMPAVAERLAARALVPSPVSRLTSGQGATDTAETPWPVLSRVVGVVMLRAWIFLSVLQFLPIWYDDLGYGGGFYGPLVSTVILAGAAGTLTGGYLADRIGGRRVLLASLLGSLPFLLLIAAVPGPVVFVAGAAFGLTADASLAVTLVAAQRLLPGRTGVASGIILGLGFVTGGIGVPITGRIADAVGIPLALAMLSVLGILATALALTIPPAALSTRNDSDERADEEIMPPVPSPATPARRSAVPAD